MRKLTIFFFIYFKNIARITYFGDYDQHGEPDDHGHDNQDDHLDHLHHLDHDDHLEDDDHLHHDELMTIKFVRMLEAVHKEVGEDGE